MAVLQLVGHFSTAAVAQWRRTDFCFLPSADFLSFTRQGVFGSALVQLRWALLTERTVDLLARQSAFVWVVTHTRKTRGNSHQERITTRHGMATYIQWRRIPDRSESITESNVKNVKCTIPDPSSPFIASALKYSTCSKTI